jgi:glycosyltransferase involved in cell wall biosynthesis
MAAIRPDAYHCHDFNTVWAGRIAAKLFPAPYVYDSHEIYAHQNIPGFTRRRRIFVTVIEWIIVRHASAVITVNDSIGRWLAKRYRIEPPTVVKNAPANPRSSVAVEIPEPLLQAGHKALYLGVVTFGRGIENIVRALEELPRVSLVLVGSGRPKYIEDIQAFAETLGVGKRLHIVPPVPHEAVVQIASRATVGLVVGRNVCLSYYLSSPTKLFEYLHAGLPVVGSDFPEIRAVVQGYGVGETCDPDDPHAIATAISSVIDDHGAYQEMRARALVAAKDFTWEAEGRRLIGVYERLLTVSSNT